MAGATTPNIDVWRYAAFTDDPNGGNPAGVVRTDAPLTDDEMQRIASEVGYSETAFLAPTTGPADLDIRYFSPEREISFCGHATIAAAVALAERSPSLTVVTVATRTDLIPLEVERGDAVTATLTSAAASSRPVDPDVLDQALATFGWDGTVLDPDLAPAVGDAGASHLILPLSSRATLRGMAYDYEALRELMLREGWTTVDVVWREDDRTYHARNPFPVGGVVEDPATGAAAAAFGGYLRDRGSLPPGAPLTIVQGEDMGRPSRLTVRTSDADARVRVTGTAVRIPD